MILRLLQLTHEQFEITTCLGWITRLPEQKGQVKQHLLMLRLANPHLIQQLPQPDVFTAFASRQQVDYHVIGRCSPILALFIDQFNHQLHRLLILQVLVECLGEEQFGLGCLLQLFDVSDGLGIVALQIQKIRVIEVQLLMLLRPGRVLEERGLQLLDILSLEMGNNQTQLGFQIIGGIAEQRLTERRNFVMLTRLDGFLDELELKVAGTFHEYNTI